MKELIGIGIMLMLAGCGPAISGGQTADSIAEGWYRPEMEEGTTSLHLVARTSKKPYT